MLKRFAHVAAVADHFFHFTPLLYSDVSCYFQITAHALRRQLIPFARRDFICYIDSVAAPE